MLIKFDSDVDATALANSVFPVPGGPYSSIPLGGFIAALIKISACLRGLFYCFF